MLQPTLQRPRGPRNPRLRDGDWLRNRYEAGASAVSIAEELGLSRRAVFDALRHHGIPVRRRGPMCPAHGEAAARLYQQGRTLREVADALGVSHVTVYWTLRRLAIPTRSPQRQAMTRRT